MQRQAGFSLVGVMVSGVILSICFVFIIQILLQTQSIGNHQQRFGIFNDLRDEVVHNMGSSCSIANTVQDPKNAALKCLYDGGCQSAVDQPLYLRTESNDLFYSPESTKNRVLTSVGGECIGSDITTCAHKLDLTYSIECESSNSCKEPNVLIQGSFSSTRSEEHGQSDQGGANAPTSAAKPADELMNYKLYKIQKYIDYSRPYLNCQDVRDRGLAQETPVQMASGMYLVDPDGPGEVCPFEVYCDLAPTSDGGGWALVANRAVGNERLNETLPPLQKGQTGKLSDSQMKALLKSSALPNGNNVRVKMNSHLGGSYVLGFRAGATGSEGKYQTNQGYCKSVEDTPTTTAFSSDRGYNFISQGNTQIGYNGNFYCNSCDVNVANSCSDMPAGGCCSDSTAVTGSLWIK